MPHSSQSHGVSTVLPRRGMGRSSLLWDATGGCGKNAPFLGTGPVFRMQVTKQGFASAVRRECPPVAALQPRAHRGVFEIGSLFRNHHQKAVVLGVFCRGHWIQACRRPAAGAGHFPRGMPGLVVDSGLDAFSQYPSRGSLTAVAARPTVETRDVARGFLSYYHMLPLSHPLPLTPAVHTW